MGILEFLFLKLTHHYEKIWKKMSHFPFSQKLCIMNCHFWQATINAEGPSIPQILLSREGIYI